MENNNTQNLVNNVIEALHTLQNGLTKLHAELKEDQKLFSWIDGDEHTPRETAYKFISQLEYHDEQAPKETIVLAGAIASSETTIQTVHNINLYKDNLHQQVMILRQARIKNDDPYLSQQLATLYKKRNLQTSHTLRKIGFARLHLKQCYRHIPVLNKKPLKISWTWANTRAITKITVQQALQKLLKKRYDGGIALQINKLKELHHNEQLAVIQELAPHLRTNLVFEDPITQEITRKMIKGPLPIFYLENHDGKTPYIVPPKPKQGRDASRKVRRDTKIAKEVFLPALRAHRYL